MIIIFLLCVGTYAGWQHLVPISNIRTNLTVTTFYTTTRPSGILRRGMSVRKCAKFFGLNDDRQNIRLIISIPCILNHGFLLPKQTKSVSVQNRSSSTCPIFLHELRAQSTKSNNYSTAIHDSIGSFSPYRASNRYNSSNPCIYSTCMVVL